MNTLENELLAGMHEHAESVQLTRDVLGAAVRRHQRRQRVGRAASAVSALVVASAVATASGLIPVGTDARHSNAPPGTAGTVASPPPGDPGATTVNAVLSRAALTAARLPRASGDQFLYTLSVGFGMTSSDRPPYLTATGRSQTRSWQSVDGRNGFLMQSRADNPRAPWTDQLRASGCDPSATPTLPGTVTSAAPIPTTAPAPTGGPADPCANAGMPTLPTHADAMLAWLYAHGADPHGYDPKPTPHTRAWFAAENLLGDYLSPASQAALFTALGRIPGVELVPAVVDAAGRTDVAVARHSGTTLDEILFDPGTGAYRGTVSTLTARTWGRPAGTVLYSVAILDQAIVPAPGQLP